MFGAFKHHVQNNVLLGFEFETYNRSALCQIEMTVKSNNMVKLIIQTYSFSDILQHSMFNRITIQMYETLHLN